MLDAGRWLQGQAVAATYSSPRVRAVESAELLRGVCRPALDDRLREISFGEFEGLTYEEIKRRFPDIYEHWMRRPTEVSFPEGESFTAMTLRVREALAAIRRNHAGHVVAVVSHAGVNRIALADALDLPLSRIFRLHQDYGCVNVIDYLDDEPVVHLVNGSQFLC
jgi:broad specificity phosphatase PhoE